MSARSLRYAVRDRRPSGLDRRPRNPRWLLADAHLSGRVAELPALNPYPRQVAPGRWRTRRARGLGRMKERWRRAGAGRWALDASQREGGRTCRD